MIVEDQSETMAFLGRAETYGVGDVKLVTTHISSVYLAGSRAYKLKRAVKLPYVDFSTLKLRKETCEKEVRLNRRTAPGLYLGVRTITREPDGRLAFDGEGVPVDAVVEMVRFDEETLFDRMAEGGQLTAPLLSELADKIQSFHRQAAVSNESGWANIEGVLAVNRAGFATSHVFGDNEVTSLNAAFESALERHRDRLDARGERGRIRHCHGDLHLRNICLHEGHPLVFDCLEFNDRLATVDVLYDLAFLLMDLWDRGLPQFANLVMNRYLDAADDDDGFVLLPFFMAVRAAVRAHVIGTQLAGGSRNDQLAVLARSYFDLARRLLDTSTPSLTAIGGFSGTGKSTVAEAIAPFIGIPPGARILESDRIRKALYGVSPETRLAPEAYAPEVSCRVYDRLAEGAATLLADGGAVLVDAVFDREDRREQVAAVAGGAGVPFCGIWLSAENEVLRRRVTERQGGASDATLAVLEHQLQADTGPIGWHAVDASMSCDAVAENVRQLLGASGFEKRNSGAC